MKILPVIICVAAFMLLILATGLQADAETTVEHKVMIHRHLSGNPSTLGRKDIKDRSPSQESNDDDTEIKTGNKADGGEDENPTYGQFDGDDSDSSSHHFYYSESRPANSGGVPRHH
ncbi:hypothetical protein Tsubulata_040593 [Turnera subulata]|uniref:Uncharacterized protein n=1 Tax=Turnera subulata TaxID=218843 RepID=A0A9Q0J5C3_9ROSI|nr:hypothetical protein Tsubulata_040593 [Turnera subulata]